MWTFFSYICCLHIFWSWKWHLSWLPQFFSFKKVAPDPEGVEFVGGISLTWGGEIFHYSGWGEPCFRPLVSLLMSTYLPPILTSILPNPMYCTTLAHEVFPHLLLTWVETWVKEGAIHVVTWEEEVLGRGNSPREMLSLESARWTHLCFVLRNGKIRSIESYFKIWGG